MKHQLLTAAGFAAMIAVASSASAQVYDDSGFYVRGQAGYGTHTDIDLTGDIVGEVESEGNGTGSLGFGYDFGSGWRLEADVASLWSDLGKVDSTPGSSAKLRTTTGMLNALYDFNDFGAFSPYVGAGAGIVRADTSTVAHDFLAAPTVGPRVASPVLGGNSVAISCDDGDTGLGWQLLAGLGYDVTDNLTWDTGYRYMQSNDLDFNCTAARAVAGQTSEDGAVTFEDVGAHSLMTGFRYRFGGATPPPAPAPLPVPPPVTTYTCWNGDVVTALSLCPVEPAPVVMATCWDGSQVTDLSLCPEQPTDRGNMISELCAMENRQEIIYYEFDKGQSPETRATIGRLLDIGQFCDVGSIRVIGHTDTSGSAAYNLALSRRRAADARSELIRQGINQAVITSEGKGETEPFVETGDGVREQLNRRTEVLVNLNTVGAMNDMSMGNTMTMGTTSMGTTSMGTMSTTTTTMPAMTSNSGDIFTDSEGRRMRMDANGNFIYVDGQ